MAFVSGMIYPGARYPSQIFFHWRMVRPSGIGAPGARNLVGRPVYTMSRELVLVVGRPYDLPGCAASANP